MFEQDLLHYARLHVGVAQSADQEPSMAAHRPLPRPDGALVQDPDFTLPTTAGPITWRLFYNSDDADVPGPWGFGRRASYPTRLFAQTDESGTSVVIEREDQTRAEYLDSGNGF